MIKICTICKLEKSLDRFAVDKRIKSGLASKCKECENNRVKTYKQVYPKTRDEEKSIRQHRVLYTLVRRCKDNASGRHNRKIIRVMDFDLTIADLQWLWQKQGGLCYYTGLALAYNSCNNNPYNASVDRLDSDRGYTPDNIVLCCKNINYMKNSLTVEDFMNFLAAVSESA
jgi:hypothetical protein